MPDNAEPTIEPNIAPEKTAVVPKLRSLNGTHVDNIAAQPGNIAPSPKPTKIRIQISKVIPPEKLSLQIKFHQCSM